MKKIYSKYDIVCFDVDSTLVTIEGIDCLAEKKGVGDAVKLLTQQAMDGAIPFGETFSQKVDLVKPSFDELIQLGECYSKNLTPGAKEVVETLTELGSEIWLVSGGFKQAILPLAKTLGIPDARILANEILFDSQGNYLGVDLSNPLTKSQGKAICAQTLTQDKRVSFIGDGVTDLVTKPVVSTFVGFGGVSTRKKVKDEAEYFIKTESLKPLLWLMM